MSFKLQDELKNATSREHLSGVYWASRDMDPGPVGNHHFFIFIYRDEAEAQRISSRWKGWDIGYRREVNDAGLAVYFSTVGVGQDSDEQIIFRFNPESDIWAVHEIAREENTEALTVDRDLQAVRLSPLEAAEPYATTEAFINAVLERIFNFNKHHRMGNTVTYAILDENCAAGVNSVLASLGFSSSYREAMGEFDGVDWGEEDIIDQSLFVMNYTGNSNTHELHAAGCTFVGQMNDDNKRVFTSLFDAIEQGYNGCATCMREFDTDSAGTSRNRYRFHPIALVCNETEDLTGADDAYLRVNGVRIWGPVRMNDGDAKVLTDAPPVEFSGFAVVSLFDKDSGYAVEDYDLAFENWNLDEDDRLGTVTIPEGMAGFGEQSCEFDLDGANYRLVYKVVEYDVNTDEPVAATGYRLMLESLRCSETEDWTGADETYLRANNILVWGPESMNDGDRKTLAGVEPIEFRGSVRLDLYDKDGSVPSDDDDHLGNFLVTAADKGRGTLRCTFDRDDASYTLEYRVEEMPPEEQPVDYRLRLVSLKCHETEDVTGADEVYLHVDNVLRWGPLSINDGETRSLAGVDEIAFRKSAALDLFDRDGDAWYDDDDHIAKVILSGADAKQGIRECSFEGDGARYTLRYEVLS